jgi:LuxR family maltose regulon positive regulatory protein
MTARPDTTAPDRGDLQPNPLLRTKLYVPPARPGLLHRPRLLERLDEGLHLGRKLTLLSAPPGFGKTTLLSFWIYDLRFTTGDSTIQSRVAWVSLDEGDNDLARFLAYLVAALQTLDPNIGQGWLGALQSPQPPPVEALLTDLLNDLAALPAGGGTGRYLLVLDDYHVLRAPPIHRAVTFLLEHLPPQMHLVIASRSDPPLPLALLRGRGQLTELRSTDLRFTADEATAFLNEIMGLALAAEDIAALEARTEGWITGLQLAGLSLRGAEADHIPQFVQEFAGSHRFVLDYLAEEVLAQQPPDVQAFLLQTSILERLSGPLCDEVVGNQEIRKSKGAGSLTPRFPDSQAFLEHLEAANLFLVPLDEQRRWYRYHRLFADLLRARLSSAGEALGCAPAPELHRRASRWFEAHNLADEAIRHALAAGDTARAADLVEGQGLSLLMRGELATLLGWLAALPDGPVCARPWLGIYHAWALALSGQPDAAESRLQAAEAASPATPPDDRLGHIAAIRSYIAAQRGDIARAVELARLALDRLDADNLVVRCVVAFTLGGISLLQGDLPGARRAFAEAVDKGQAAGNLHLAVPALAQLARLQTEQGRLHQALATYQRALDLAGRLPVAAQATSGQGALDYEWNDLAAAERLLARSVELDEQWGNVDALCGDYAALARVYQAQGDPQRGRDLLDKAEQLVRDRGLHPEAAALLAAARIRLDLSAGRLGSAQLWLRERGLGADDEFTYVREGEYLALAHILLALGQVDDAARLLARLLAATERDGRLGRAVEVLALQALVHQAQGDAALALAALERALALAEPEGYVRTFVDLGEPLAKLLSAVSHQRSAVSGEYVARLLTAFPDSRFPSTRSLALPLVEPLSEREMEVLRLVAEGLTNQEIADELVIALSTVKSHTNSIYGKLGVKNRTQAVAAAHELGLEIRG